METVKNFPILVLLILLSSLFMMIPALHAALVGDWDVSRVFLYHGIFLSLMSGIVGTATLNRTPKITARYHLVSLLAAYIVLPIFLALPLHALSRSFPTELYVSFGDIYFEMLSCLTTTGATLIDRPNLIPASFHLWRSMVGWLGGLIALVTAYAILAPLNLGGFEIGIRSLYDRKNESGSSVENAGWRLISQTTTILPVYFSLTFILGLSLIVLGDSPIVAATHAMATLSTSGISAVTGMESSMSGRAGEMLIAFFLLSAISYGGLTKNILAGKLPSASNPQFQLMLICVLSVTVVLFLRNYWGAVEIERQDSLASIGRAIWGGIFTSLSFLTTTGFESRDWQAMQIWSGLSDPGIILLGLSVMGGGVATTAGGVKLLRIYALYRHGLREMDFLVHPNSLERHGRGDKMISKRGPQIAFVFMMLFLVSIASLMILFSITGQEFERSVALSIAALTTTGPAVRALEASFLYSQLSNAAKFIFGVGMVIGRMEILVILALFNPNFWRS